LRRGICKVRKVAVKGQRPALSSYLRDAVGGEENLTQSLTGELGSMMKIEDENKLRKSLRARRRASRL
jgi:hypothetical protein